MDHVTLGEKEDNNEQGGVSTGSAFRAPPLSRWLAACSLSNHRPRVITVSEGQVRFEKWMTMILQINKRKNNDKLRTKTQCLWLKKANIKPVDLFCYFFIEIDVVFMSSDPSRPLAFDLVNAYIITVTVTSKLLPGCEFEIDSGEIYCDFTRAAPIGRRNVCAFTVTSKLRPGGEFEINCDFTRTAPIGRRNVYAFKSAEVNIVLCLDVILWVYAVKYPQKEGSLSFREIIIASVNEDLDDTENQCFTKETSLELSKEIILFDFGIVFDENEVHIRPVDLFCHFFIEIDVVFMSSDPSWPLAFDLVNAYIITVEKRPQLVYNCLSAITSKLLPDGEFEIDSGEINCDFTRAAPIGRRNVYAFVIPKPDRSPPRYSQRQQASNCRKEVSLSFREIIIASVNEDLDDTENQCFTRETSFELSKEIISIPNETLRVFVGDKDHEIDFCQKDGLPKN
uniref:DUF5727 domain-containing protein n=1 Tax=Panagrellus redivivus TaxID=6233 RepID=A0A7E4W5Z5_PANRE